MFNTVVSTVGTSLLDSTAEIPERDGDPDEHSIDNAIYWNSYIAILRNDAREDGANFEMPQIRSRNVSL